MTQASAIDANEAANETETKQEGQADVEVRDAELSEVRDSGNRTGTGKIDILLDTTVEVTATFGSVRMPVGELLRMGSGAIIQLDRVAGDPVDLLLNGIPFATGSLVVVENQLAVRLKEVQAPESTKPSDDAEAPPTEAEAGESPPS